MLIRAAHLRAIADGRVTLAFRRWRSPTVKAGGTLRTAVGVLAIDAVDVVQERDITADDARAAGYDSRDALLADLASRPDGRLYRIRLRLAGRDPRETLRERATLDSDDLAHVREKLQRLDARGRYGPWTLAVLRGIRDHPALRAGDLAEHLGHPRDWLKVNIRKLKELGLTESLETGYRLSPRGETVLRALS